MAVLVRGRAPLRISFAGGGTDLSPYVDEFGGVVLNATIDRYAYATMRVLPERILRLTSRDLGTAAEYRLSESLVFDGTHDLLLACVRRMVPQLHQLDIGLEFYLETDAPRSAGLGGSSALVVAMIGALRKWQHVRLNNYQMAHLAWEIERKDVLIPGGKQDQYAAVFGGFNLIEFHPDESVIVNSLRIEPELVNELQYNMVLVHTGLERGPSRVIEAQVAGFTEQRSSMLAAMESMKALTYEAKNALLTGRLRRLGEILHEEWQAKKQTATSVTNARIDEMYDEARRLGAVGGKLSGAGGGGFMFFYCPFTHRPAVVKRLVDLGCQEFGFAFEPNGMRSWVWEDAP